MARFYPVVLAGGAGTRFWPASRRAQPKPFVPLVGRRTLLEETLLRLKRLAPAERISVVASEELAAVTRRALHDWSEVRVLLEPEARNTAAAIAWAAACVAGVGDDAVLGVFPADHHIPDAAAFARTTRQAIRAAADGEHLVLIGIEPRRADTAYGYLKLGRAGRRSPALPVERFVEKPKAAAARRYARSGEHLWNAGMVVARPERILAETRAHAPEVWDALGAVLEAIAAGKRVSRARVARAYRRVVKLSFDYAVLERSARVRAVRGRFAWSDLGSWDALVEHLPERDRNHVHGGAPVAIDASGNLVWNATGRQIVLVGVSDLAVVETGDALLVCPLDRAQDVRRAVVELEKRKRTDLT